ncbi:hypothetical protein BC835DRAFT_1358423 [Cytidiella melzeri]|nr:hypothetical protein BC835DRAFT_1358423 [Cytidiella melzeri]
MQFSTSLFLFTAVIIGTLHAMTASALPHNSAGSYSSSPSNIHTRSLETGTGSLDHIIKRMSPQPGSQIKSLEGAAKGLTKGMGDKVPSGRPGNGASPYDSKRGKNHQSVPGSKEIVKNLQEKILAHNQELTKLL